MFKILNNLIIKNFKHIQVVFFLFSVGSERISQVIHFFNALVLLRFFFIKKRILFQIHKSNENKKSLLSIIWSIEISRIILILVVSLLIWWLTISIAIEWRLRLVIILSIIIWITIIIIS
jgi:hypothetical protein